LADLTKTKRLENLLLNPLIDQALSRAAIFYASTDKPEMQKPYLDLRVEISRELKAK